VAKREVEKRGGEERLRRERCGEEREERLMRERDVEKGGVEERERKGGVEVEAAG
jgi:hypothetical protein